jgi:predicted dehydrogenase
VNLSRWFLGVSPTAVTGMADRLVHDFGDVEDNAILLVRYPDAICSFEATWSQPAGDGLNGPVVFGSEGTLLATTQDGREGVLLKRSNEDIQFIAGEDPASGHRSGPEHLVHCLETGESLFAPVTPELNLEVIAVLQAGESAARTGQTVQLPPFEV